LLRTIKFLFFFDRDVQSRGCFALGDLAYNGEAGDQKASDEEFSICVAPCLYLPLEITQLWLL
jgi:hypothetical protein